jgi:hypothetical protein
VMDFKGNDNNLAEIKNQSKWPNCFQQNWKYKSHDQLRDLLTSNQFAKTFVEIQTHCITNWEEKSKNAKGQRWQTLERREDHCFWSCFKLNLQSKHKETTTTKLGVLRGNCFNSSKTRWIHSWNRPGGFCLLIQPSCLASRPSVLWYVYVMSE